MSGLPGHDIAVALLDACGIPSANARAVTFRAEINQITNVEVTYYITKQGDPSKLAALKRVRFVEVAEAEDGAA